MMPPGTDHAQTWPLGGMREGWPQAPAIMPAALDWSLQRILVFIAVHIPLAFLVRWVPLVGIFHSLACLLIGLRWLVRDRTTDRLIFMTAYINAIEPIWRGVNATIFYEYAKYAICLLLGLAILRHKLFRAASKVPLIYFLLLLPSILVMHSFDREQVAFNLSGPFTLAVATIFFSSQKLVIPSYKKILLAMLGPCAGLCAMASLLSLSAEEFEVHGKAGSAGYAPNQVSSILGLGAILAFIYLLLERRSKSTRSLMFVLMLWFLAQSALTLSRGGLWAALFSMGAASFYLLRDRRARFVIVLRAVVALVLGAYLVFPFVNSMTGGVLAERFRSFDATGRDRIIEGDLLAFRENPLWGVGPGQAKTYHERTFRLSSAHTEYTRLLAEHGMLGVLALLLLFFMCSRRALSSLPLKEKAIVACLTTWSLLFMLHAAMRLAAPGFVFGLAAARLFALPPPDDSVHLPSSNPVSGQVDAR